MVDLSKYANQVYKIIGASMAVHSELGWGEYTNECYIVDRNMEPLSEVDYEYLLDEEEN